jgi:hypothetical protein
MGLNKRNYLIIFSHFQSGEYNPKTGQIKVEIKPEDIKAVGDAVATVIKAVNPFNNGGSGGFPGKGGGCF